MEKDPALYREELESVVKQLSANNIIAKIKGEGISQFVYAKCDDRTVELSQDKDGIWVEFWLGDSENPKNAMTISSYHEALKEVLSWLMM
ncbi:hypothetical protein D1AOALGA4SA_12101 [Olavius algarvensis Delta 1 endosymbiont]|nr:hypothetical protein D1AOALGA4SA_12101 [Olavius algarvensis Delta 1 endosymbiont]